MEVPHGSFGTTHKQLEHVLGLGDDSGDDNVGDYNVVKEKRERM